MKVETYGKLGIGWSVFVTGVVLINLISAQEDCREFLRGVGAECYAGNYIWSLVRENWFFFLWVVFSFMAYVILGIGVIWRSQRLIQGWLAFHFIIVILGMFGLVWRSIPVRIGDLVWSLWMFLGTRAAIRKS